MTDSAHTEHRRAVNTFTWSVRACALGPALAGVALVLALFDMGGRDITVLSAITLLVCFVAVFFGLAGLFGLALAHETPDVPPSPHWCVPCGVASILGSFAIGLFGLLT
jgi:hypothetical protein